jgi:hypothetical protein
LLASGNVVVDNPGTLEGDGVTEPQGGDCYDGRTGCETPFVGEMERLGPDLSWAQMVR